jgi:uncharacterized membrane protein YphA (DoxX/SURF4 family)
MIDHRKTSPLRRFSTSSYDKVPMNWQQKGVGVTRIIFGLVLAAAAVLKWQPEFQNTFVAQVAAAQGGQPAPIMGWIAFWTHIVSVNPLLFARIEASTETALAIFLLLGVLSNLAYVIGMLLSLGIWSIPEGFGGPYVAGKSTDIGAGLLYAIVFALLLFLSAGRYYGLDSWFTKRLGRLGFLASGSFRRH